MRSRLVAAGKRFENNADMKYAPRWLSTGNQSGPRPQGQRPCRQNDVRPLIGRCIRGPHQISCRAIRGRVGTRRRPIRRRCADCKCKKKQWLREGDDGLFLFLFCAPNRRVFEPPPCSPCRATWCARASRRAPPCNCRWAGSTDGCATSVSANSFTSECHHLFLFLFFFLFFHAKRPLIFFCFY